MPIILVGDEVFKRKLDCIVNPIKGNELYFYAGVEGKIMASAGKYELIQLFHEANPFESLRPFVTSGLRLSNNIIHIVATEMSRSLDFRKDMYFAYDRVIRKAMDLNVKKLVFPCIPYAYKRKGRMHTYKTAINLVRFLYKWYNPDFTIYLHVDKDAVTDHVNKYEFDYTSYTLPISRRHKPLDYPFTSQIEAKSYFLQNFYETTKFEDYVKNKHIDFERIDDKYALMYELISLKYKDHAHFYCEANISKKRFEGIMSGNIRPSKGELLAMCIVLKFDLKQTIKVLREDEYSLSEKALIPISSKEYLFLYNSAYLE